MFWSKLGRKAAGLAYLEPVLYMLLVRAFGLNKLAGATFQLSLSYRGLGTWFTVAGSVELITGVLAGILLLLGKDERFKKFIYAEAAVSTLYVVVIGTVISKEQAIQALASSLIFRFLVLLSYFIEDRESKTADRLSSIC